MNVGKNLKSYGNTPSRLRSSVNNKSLNVGVTSRSFGIEMKIKGHKLKNVEKPSSQPNKKDERRY